MAGPSRALLALWLAALAPAVCVAAPGGNGGATVKVTPGEIRIGLFYHGTDVLVAGDVPRSDGVIIKIEGGDGEVVLNKKGKLGFIWLNVAQVTVKNAPRVYILAASRAPAELCSREDRRRLGLGLDALRGRIAFESKAPLTGSEFDEFLKLKRHSGAYDDGVSVDLAPAGEGRQEAAARLPIPAAVPPGDYQVRLYCFSDRTLTAEAGATLSVEKVGTPLLMTELAHRYGAAYGALAVVIGMAAGILIGLVFSSRRGGGH
jgi:uncharacterized protein (TIGR02186 family)